MRTLIASLITLMVLTTISTEKIVAQENQEKDIQKELIKKKLEKEKQQKEMDSIFSSSKIINDKEMKEQSDLMKQYFKSPKSKFRENRNGGYRNSAWSYQVMPDMGGGDNTNFTISKNLKDIMTFSSDFEYEVPANVTGLYFEFSGELETGSLKITITKPGGKVFQTFSVAPIANVDWNKRISIKEAESKDYSGTWKITISSKEAKGYYELRINSY